VRQEKDSQRGGIPLSAKGGRRDLVSSVHTISLKIALFFLSPGACLREAASAKAGEREGVRGEVIFRVRG